MKRMNLFLAAGLLCLALTGCGQAAETGNTPETGNNPTTESSTQENQDGSADASPESQTPDNTEDTQPDAGNTDSSEDTDTPEDSGKTYADNFAVDSEAAADFGKKIKDAVANKDLDALTALASFPLYVGFEDGGESFDSEDAFTELGADRIFTDELLESIAAADETTLSASRAGFVLSKETGAPNVVFSVVNGKLAVQGINY